MKASFASVSFVSLSSGSSSLTSVRLVNKGLGQGWATYGPRAGSGPPSIFIRPTSLGQCVSKIDKHRIRGH